MTIRPATSKDAHAICRIYNHYVKESISTFEEEPVEAKDMTWRIENIARTNFPWLVSEDEDGNMLGYAYACRWRSRSAYRYSAESTIYVDHTAAGRGVGTRLYSALIDVLRDLGIHAVMGGIALPNAASVALHENLGFHRVARFEQVGRKFDRWIDVGYWQLILG